MIRNIKTLSVAFALALTVATLYALRTSAADDGSSSKHFRATVSDVIGTEDSVVKQIRIEANPDSRATITSDKKGGGGLSASVGAAEGQPELGIITITVLADHVEWKGGEVNALKFMMLMHGNGSKALMSDTGPMLAAKQLNELLAVSLMSGEHEYGTAIPILKFKDRTYSLTVEAPAPKR